MHRKLYQNLFLIAASDPFTVFAPVDDVFDIIGDNILNNEHLMKGKRSTINHLRGRRGPN